MQHILSLSYGKDSFWSVEDVLNKPVRKRLNGHRIYAKMNLEEDE